MFAAAFFLLAISSFLEVFKSLGTNNGSRLAYPVASILVVLLVSGLRWETGTDWNEYVIHYDTLVPGSIPVSLFRFQFVYTYLVLLFSFVFSFPYQLFLLSCSAVFSFALFRLSTFISAIPSSYILLFYSFYWIPNILGGPRRAIVWCALLLLYSIHKNFLRVGPLSQMLICTVAVASHSSGAPLVFVHYSVLYLLSLCRNRKSGIYTVLPLILLTLLVSSFSFSRLYISSTASFLSGLHVTGPLALQVDKIIAYSSNPQFIESSGYTQSSLQLLMGISKPIIPILSSYLLLVCSRSVLPSSISVRPRSGLQFFSYESFALIAGVLIYVMFSFSRPLQSASFYFLSFSFYFCTAFLAATHEITCRFISFALVFVFCFISFFSVLSTGFWSSW